MPWVLTNHEHLTHLALRPHVHTSACKGVATSLCGASIPTHHSMMQGCINDPTWSSKSSTTSSMSSHPSGGFLFFSRRRYAICQQRVRRLACSPVHSTLSDHMPDFLLP